MENEYYRLFVPLTFAQKKDIFKIWKDNIIEDVYNKNKEIEKYCKENECDYMMALYRIYESYNTNYICSYSEQNSSISDFKNDYINNFELTNFITNRLNKLRGKDKTKQYRENIEAMFLVLKEKNMYGFDEANEQGFNDFNLININRIYQNIDERKFLRDSINKIILQRRENPDEYLKMIFVTKTREGLDTIPEYSLTGFEELMYLSCELNSETIDFENKKKIIYSSPIYSNEQLHMIYLLLVKGEYIDIATENDDFLCIFGNEAKNDNFKTLKWIKIAKNKEINKRMFLYLCMKIFDLKRDELNFYFFKYINSLTDFESKLDYNNKPDKGKIYEEIDILLKEI